MPSEYVPPAPPISVLLPAYNGAPFIGDAIRSVLDQTFPDFELLVIDDGSTDATAEIVGGFEDERIRYYSQSNNGASHAINRAVLLSRGSYLAFMTQDDVCHPDRLGQEYRFLRDTGNKAVFSWVDFIDDDGESLDDSHFAGDFFNHPNRSRAEILHWFFFKGNYFCAPTCLVARDILRETGPVVPTLAQLPDFSMWIRIVKWYDLMILPERLLKFRIRTQGENSSSPKNLVRIYFEDQQVYRTMFDGLSLELFKSAFQQHLRNPDFVNNAAYELEKSFLYLLHSSSHVKSIGAERLYRQLQDDALLQLAMEQYDFGLPEFLELTSTIDIWGARYLQAEREYAQHKEAELLALLERYRAHEEELERFHVGYRAELKRLSEEFDTLRAGSRDRVEAHD